MTAFIGYPFQLLMPERAVGGSQKITVYLPFLELPAVWLSSSPEAAFHYLEGRQGWTTKPIFRSVKGQLDHASKLVYTLKLHDLYFSQLLFTYPFRSCQQFGCLLPLRRLSITSRGDKDGHKNKSLEAEKQSSIALKNWSIT